MLMQAHDSLASVVTFAHSTHLYVLRFFVCFIHLYTLVPQFSHSEPIWTRSENFSSFFFACIKPYPNFSYRPSTPYTYVIITNPAPPCARRSRVRVWHKFDLHKYILRLLNSCSLSTTLAFTLPSKYSAVHWECNQWATNQMLAWI